MFTHFPVGLISTFLPHRTGSLCTSSHQRWLHSSIKIPPPSHLQAPATALFPIHLMSGCVGIRDTGGGISQALFADKDIGLSSICTLAQVKTAAFVSGTASKSSTSETIHVGIFVRVSCPHLGLRQESQMVCTSCPSSLANTLLRLSLNHTAELLSTF